MPSRRWTVLVVVTLLLGAGLVLPLENDEACYAPGHGPLWTTEAEGAARPSELAPSLATLASAGASLFNITVSFSYELLDGMETAPCAGAFVQLRLGGTSAFHTVRSGHTNADGSVTFTGLVPGTYMARIEADDDRWARVADGSMSTTPNYHWSTQQFSADRGMGLEYLIRDEARGAWAIYDAIRDGGQWLHDLTGWERSQVTAVWPEGYWPHSHGNEIHIPSDEHFEGAAWQRDIALHEYAHCVHFELRGGSFPDGAGPDPHYIDSESSPGFAFTEGWAEFFERAVEGDPLRADGSSLESTVFADGPFGHGDAGDMDGVIVEGAVANVLWDLYDGVDPLDRPDGSARGDMVDRQFALLWDIMYYDAPNSLVDVKRAWPMRDANITVLFRNARVPMELDPPRNPDRFQSSHPIGEGSLDSTLSVIWWGARDEGSGVLGYSILLSRDRNATPDLVMDQTGSSYTSHPLSPGTYYLHIRTVDQDGNWAGDVVTVGPFVILEGAVPVDGPMFPEGDVRMAFLGLAIVLAVVCPLLVLVVMMERHQLVSRTAPGPHALGSCPYCGRSDHGGEYCPYCGGRIR